MSLQTLFVHSLHKTALSCGCRNPRLKRCLGTQKTARSPWSRAERFSGYLRGFQDCAAEVVAEFRMFKAPPPFCLDTKTVEPLYFRGFFDHCNSLHFQRRKLPDFQNHAALHVKSHDVGHSDEMQCGYPLLPIFSDNAGRCRAAA